MLLESSTNLDCAAALRNITSTARQISGCCWIACVHKCVCYVPLLAASLCLQPKLLHMDQGILLWWRPMSNCVSGKLRVRYWCSAQQYQCRFRTLHDTLYSKGSRVAHFCCEQRTHTHTHMLLW